MTLFSQYFQLNFHGYSWCSQNWYERYELFPETRNKQIHYCSITLLVHRFLVSTTTIQRKQLENSVSVCFVEVRLG